MFCSGCGKQLPDEASYCPHCGMKLPNQERSDLKDQENGTQQVVAGIIDTAGSVADAARKADRNGLMPIILRGLLMALTLLVPWFDVNYYLGSTGVNLFSIGSLLSQGASLGNSLSSLTGTSSSVPGGLEFMSWICFLLGAIPVALLAKEMYDYRKRGAKEKYGAVCVIAAALLSALLILAINATVMDAISDYGATADVLTLGLGWWAAVIASAAVLWIERDHAD